MKVAGLEILRCDAGWRNYHFLKLTTDDSIVGWSEFDKGFGSPGVSAVIERLAARVVGQDVFDHERIFTELYCFTRPAAGGVLGEGLGAIENDGTDPRGSETLVELAPADDPVIGRHFQEMVISPAGIAAKNLKALDSHRLTPSPVNPGPP